MHAAPETLTRAEAIGRLKSEGHALFEPWLLVDHAAEMIPQIESMPPAPLRDRTLAILRAYVRRLTRADETVPETRVLTWDPIGGRPIEPTEGDMLEGATMGTTAPLTEDELADIETRTSGPGPLAGDGDVLRRLVAEVRTWRAVRKAPPLDVRTRERKAHSAPAIAMAMAAGAATSPPTEAIHQLPTGLTAWERLSAAAHTAARAIAKDSPVLAQALLNALGGAEAQAIAEVRALRDEVGSLEAAFGTRSHEAIDAQERASRLAAEVRALRTERGDAHALDTELARAIRDTLGETTYDGVIERLEELLDVEKENVVRDAPTTDASLEARATAAKNVYDATVDGPTDEADLRGWLAVVRAVDASRPAAPTPERAATVIAFLRENFLNDGAEGESVHLACDMLEAALASQAVLTEEQIDVLAAAMPDVVDYARATPEQRRETVIDVLAGHGPRPVLLRAYRGEAPPAAAEPVPDSIGPRGSSAPIKHDCGDAACPHHGRTSALGSMAPGVIAEASRADVYAPAAELLRERWIDVGGTAHASNCSGQLDANGCCYCGAVGAPVRHRRMPDLTVACNNKWADDEVTNNPARVTCPDCQVAQAQTDEEKKP